MAIDLPLLEDKIIVIAEDEPINFMILEKMLEATKARIVWAKNGEEAINKSLEISEIALILMDIRMPIVDGIQATLEIRKTNTEVPIVAVTAYTLSNEKDLCKQAGTTAFLTKPVRPKELAETLNSIFS